MALGQPSPNLSKYREWKWKSRELPAARVEEEVVMDSRKEMLEARDGGVRDLIGM